MSKKCKVILESYRTDKLTPPFGFDTVDYFEIDRDEVEGREAKVFTREATKRGLWMQCWSLNGPENADYSVTVWKNSQDYLDFCTKVAQNP